MTTVRFNSHRTRDILAQLRRLTDAQQGRHLFVIFGGLAVDGHIGRLTRQHSDIDCLCWRKDVPEIRKILRSLGFRSEYVTHPDEPSYRYRMVTTDKQKTISFQILDKSPGDTFIISFYRYHRTKVPREMLKASRGKIDDIHFPVASRRFLVWLKKRDLEFYQSQRRNTPKRFLKNHKKYANTLHDLRLLRAR